MGVVVGESSLTLGGGGALTLVAPQDGGWLGDIPPLVTARVDATGGSLRFRIGGGEIVPSGGVGVLVTGSHSGTRVALNGREYRGAVRLRLSGSRIDAINELDLEEYLAGVVGAEMGLRGEREVAALLAQAVVSRTIALRRIAASRERAWDILATVADQAYAGAGYETELGLRAARETWGQALTYSGQLIDGFFHSTCGGRTAPGAEVFAAGGRPYLRAIADVDEAGRPWCVISPRYRWRETWSGEALASTLRETLPLVRGPVALASTLRNILVAERTGTGRVGRLVIEGVRDTFAMSGPLARQVFRTTGGSVLRSATFTVQLTREGGRIVLLAVDGAGAGHGVGMCQWGSIGRARAGFPYPAILSAYFPGTELSRVY